MEWNSMNCIIMQYMLFNVSFVQKHLKNSNIN